MGDREHEPLLPSLHVEPTTPPQHHSSGGRSTRSIRFSEVGAEEEGGQHASQRFTSEIEAKHDAINHLFGTKKFKSHIVRRRFEERSPLMQSLLEADPKKGMESDSPGIMVGNVLWVALLGWPVSLVYLIVGALLVVTWIGRHYGIVCWRLAAYFLWPFGKYLERLPSQGAPTISLISTEEARPLRGGPQKSTVLQKVAYILWLLIAVPPGLVVHLVVGFISWMFVVYIPMAKINKEVFFLLFKNPLTLAVVKDYPHAGAEILLYTNHAFNLYYYKYTVAGMNVLLVNLIPFVFLSIAFGYLFDHKIPTMVTFVCCLLSTIPLSYYNGMAIASLSAQTSMAAGAVLNATFGSIIELILYVVTINQGLEEVVRAALTGSLLGALLLIPGMSMVLGGIKYKEQRFSPAVAGVSSVLLVISIVGAFTPTIYYRLYGNYVLDCSNCTITNGAYHCTQCQQEERDLDNDPIYTGKARTLMFICAAILPLAYIVGLVFTLKTHTHILYAKPDDKHHAEEEEEEEQGGHGEAVWSKWQSLAVLVVCTCMFALISEKLVEGIQDVTATFNVSQIFLGVSVLAVVPTAAEYLNAVQFALSNNMPLALEIGASVAVQITLFQMPMLVFYSAFRNHLVNRGSFTLIFPMLHFYVVFFSVLILNLIYSYGKANYFIGAALLSMYIIILACFYFV